MTESLESLLDKGNVKVKRVSPKYKQLEEQLGGKWKYNRRSHMWECDDGRMVWAVKGCSCDYDCGSSSRYYCYGGKGPAVAVHFIGQGFSLCTSPPR